MSMQEPVEERAAAEFGRSDGCGSSVTSLLIPTPQAPLTPVFLVAAPVNLRESRHVSHLEPCKGGGGHH